jgi:pyrimidine-nucleoside phosphorylase
MLGGVARDAADGRARIERALADGSALEVFRRLVEAQGGDPRVCDSPGAVLPRARSRDELTLPPGRIAAIDGEALGTAAVLLGAGRRTTDDAIDPAAGLVIDAYLGELIEPGAPPQVILCHDLRPGDGRLAEARALIESAFTIDAPSGPPPAPPGSRILEILR